MHFWRFGVVCPLAVASCAAFDQAVPPVPPFDASNLKSTLEKAPVAGFNMGALSVRFEQTTLNDIRRAAASGDIAHRGDAGDGIHWLCYTNLGSPVTERIWVTSGEMGGPMHAVTAVTAHAAPIEAPTADCPALPKNLQPLSLDNHLWLGASAADTRLRLGPPSFQKNEWQSYNFAGKARGKCGATGFDLVASLSLHFYRDGVDSLYAGQITSC